MGDRVKKSPLLSVARKMIPVLPKMPIVEMISCFAVYNAIPFPRPQWYLEWYPSLTGAAAVVVGALDYGQMGCCVLQAAAGLLAPMLKGRSRRSCWALTFVALVASAVNHSIWGIIEGGLLAIVNPGEVPAIVAVMIGVIIIGAFELAAFVVLFQGEDQEIYGSA
ncbi:hypothetical protein EJB05_41179, partial [Eragrostis curvula]